MATVALPVRDDMPHFSFQTELDGATYGFEFWWNERMPGWLMSISTADGDPILTGLHVVVEWPLIDRFADARLPPGQLIALDTSSKKQDPGLNDLGARVRIVYTPAADL